MFMYINAIAGNATTCTTAGQLRTCLFVNPSQKSVLEAAFVNNSYLNKTTLMQAVQQTGLCEKEIICWFVTRRAGVGRASKEGTIAIREYIHVYQTI